MNNFKYLPDRISLASSFVYVIVPNNGIATLVLFKHGLSTQQS